MTPKHPMHRVISDMISGNLPQNCILLKDTACGGDQHIPLYCKKEKSRRNHYCNVDLLILKENKIRAIIEIEESDIKPLHIFGKFLTSAFSKYCIHERKGTFGMHDEVDFIQIVDASRLKAGTSKPEQWGEIRNSIKSLLPIDNSNIGEYKLFSDNQFDQLIQSIKGL